MIEKALQNLQKYWGYESFREGQEDAIRSALDGKDTVVLFPTGGGKSLCYQVPATVFKGMTLVISPLVALMQDQVQQLKERNIPATFINSTLSSWEIEQRLVNARNGMYKLLYCSPERLKTSLWEAELPKLNIDLVAIDEAHCISEWGHDFRPSYREIRESLEPLDDSTAWMALTATATPEVRKDIIDNLGFEEAEIISKGYDRPNLYWWVVKAEKKREKLLNAVKKASSKGAGLIYGGTRRNCEELAKLITDKLSISTKAYHAGVEQSERIDIQEQWIAGDLPLVAATNAFGMGIDKSDCRYVVHYQMPYSLEAYYQEAGRAGRDRVKSYPILLYKPADSAIAEKRLKDSYPEKEQLQKVYDALCDTFELAVNTGMEEAEQVSIPALQKRSSLPFRIVKSSLKVLNQLGVIQLIDYIVPQIGVQFVAAEDYIRNTIDTLENDQKAAFLDTLYRQYGPESFADMKYLEVDYLKRKLNQTENAIVKGLQVLQAHDQILKYEALGELPLVRLTEERQRNLPFGRKELEKHRNSLLKKLEYMERYIQTDLCREVFIRRYFGEEDVSVCGHCDNCLQEHQKQSTYLDNQNIREISEILKAGSRS
ncbi:MAG: ATP-dependent DNA helicase RecQ, partial [Balneolaceae bacterium]|nr:ATP-dependent DNA helicase RecQ [Balneolaceae bacterium]